MVQLWGKFFIFVLVIITSKERYIILKSFSQVAIGKKLGILTKYYL